MSLDALQTALAGEHAAVYGYGVLGAVLSGARERDARAGLDAHRGRRDRLRSLVIAAGGTPAEAAPAYRLPFPVSDPATAVRLAVHLETQIAIPYAELVAAESGRVREFAARALQDAAVRAARWRGSSVPFPGLPAPPEASPPPS